MLIITVGISGSGKTTWAKQQWTFKIVCLDDIRKELTNDISDQSKNNEVWMVACERLKTYLDCDRDVIFDSTGCSIDAINSLIGIANSFDWKIAVYFKLFETDIETAYNRIQQDLKDGIERFNVPKVVIENQYNKYKSVVKYIQEQKLNVEYFKF